jgi:hypothetical protein
MPPSQSRKREYWALGLIFLFYFVHGIIYIFLIPPWQHYDEPTHFEYAWLLANQGDGHDGGRQLAQYDQAMRREVAASMIEHDFFVRMGFQSNLLAQDEPVWIGISQRGDPALYYWITSIPLRILRATDVTFQLYVTRMASFLLYLFAALCFIFFAREITSESSSLRLILPAAIALLPGFVDIMTATNNDVGAVAFFSLFLWSGVRLMRRGFSWLTLLVFFAATAACMVTKINVIIAAILVALPILFTLFTGRLRPVAWAVIGLGVLTVIVASLGWGAPAGWISNHPHAPQVRLKTSQAPLGRQVWRFQPSENPSSSRFYQIYPSSSARQLAGEIITVGAWIWGSSANGIPLPRVETTNQTFSQSVPVTPEPTFYAYSIQIPEDVQRIFFALDIPAIDVESEIYYDGLVAAIGERPLEQAPEFTGSNGDRGFWGGQEFTNLIQNGSAETGGPYLRNWILQYLRRYFVASPSLALTSLLNPRQAGWYYQETTVNLFKTFWAQFGWGHVPLRFQFLRPYHILLVVTITGLVGSALAAWRRRQNIRWDILVYLGLSLLFLWGFAFYRGIDSITSMVFIPGSRYAYPAIFPTMFILCLGWVELLQIIETKLKLPAITKFILLGLFFLALDAASIASIIWFYQS